MKFVNTVFKKEPSVMMALFVKLDMSKALHLFYLAVEFL